MLPLDIILFSAIPNHTFSCKEVPSTKSPGGKSLQFKLHLLHSSSSQRVAPSAVPPTSWIISSITKVTKQRTRELKECDLPQGHFNEASKYLRGANQPSQQVLGACNTHQESINTLLKLVDSRMIIKTSWNWLLVLFSLHPYSSCVLQLWLDLGSVTLMKKWLNFLM